MTSEVYFDKKYPVKEIKNAGVLANSKSNPRTILSIVARLKTLFFISVAVLAVVSSQKQ